MTERRARRRLTAFLLAALFGALTFTPPAHAATSCELSFKANWRGMVGTQHLWQVDTKFHNIGTAASTNWDAVIGFAYSQGATLQRFWNIKRLSTYQWVPASWNKVIPAGQSATFGFEILVPNETLSPLPTAVGCSITY
ncbi:cellulose binding domain-containing protein [Herbidospora cretacea]|uniref:cellulose binding domain-containing protein n=1 Tax=Herbidospora cretacea TaxID=28444 RepID=UPI000774CC55|nr:cellulose binding domain-containing protein [Herbidospora cretacea]